MTEETIRKIELAQQKLKNAQAVALSIIQRQQERLDINRRAIDEAAELVYAHGAKVGNDEPS